MTDTPSGRALAAAITRAYYAGAAAGAATERERIRRLAEQVGATYTDGTPCAIIGAAPFAALLTEPQAGAA